MRQKGLYDDRRESLIILGIYTFKIACQSKKYYCLILKIRHICQLLAITLVLILDFLEDIFYDFSCKS